VSPENNLKEKTCRALVVTIANTKTITIKRLLFVNHAKAVRHSRVRRPLAAAAILVSISMQLLAIANFVRLGMSLQRPQQTVQHAQAANTKLRTPLHL
jgi:hypothetical protein